ncbi:HAD-IA family hydrolase [Phycisphaeraceae bacterium D3-23]
MPEPDIQLVVFDLGGVLIRLAPSWRDAFTHAGLPYPKQLDAPETTVALEKLVEIEEVGGFGKLGFFDKAGELLGIESGDLIRAADAYLRGPFPGIPELLDVLMASPIPTACLSNTNHNHWKDLANPDHPNGLPLLDLDHPVASQLVGHRKPNPGIYQHLEESTGIQAQNILFFDDRQDNIDAANDRGWNTHRVTHPTDTAPEIRAVLARHNIQVESQT